MVEPVRLVIWDLDETFWKGTLTEGGIQYSDENHALVMELAERGIMSSIVSKNDLAPVREILQAKGLWDYFIFPSINWEPKGPRIAALVEAVQLRPPTILFVDDNPLNRNEALHFVPELQVSAETVIPGMRDDKLFKGKPDKKLTRLAQYKVLETRHQDIQASSDNKTFLEGSNIRVTIIPTVDEHLDRAVDLINRTNQLNFTKRRLPEDIDAARAELSALLAQYDVQAGLVHVQDRYGDYGLIGLYVMRTNAAVRTLLHYCFSCRTLGMGVERWVYDLIGRPTLRVQGEVLTDLDADADITWINTGSEQQEAGNFLNKRIVVRGGCDLTSVSHYLALSAGPIAAEVNSVRLGLPVRLDHSAFLAGACDDAADSPELMAAAREIGYEPEDFRSEITNAPDTLGACVFSFWMDAHYATYTHRDSGLRVPFVISGPKNGRDVRAASDAELREDVRGDQAYEAVVARVAVLRREYDFAPVSSELLVRNVGKILDYIPAHVPVIILLGAEQVVSEGRTVRVQAMIAHNDTIRAIVAGRRNVHLLRITDFVERDDEVQTALHFSRMVYFRLSQEILRILSADEPVSDSEARPLVAAQ